MDIKGYRIAVNTANVEVCHKLYDTLKSLGEVQNGYNLSRSPNTNHNIGKGVFAFKHSAGSWWIRCFYFDDNITAEDFIKKFNKPKYSVKEIYGH